MREKKSIREAIGTPLRGVIVVLLFFGAMLMVLWTVIALVRFVLGSA